MLVGSGILTSHAVTVALVWASLQCQDRCEVLLQILLHLLTKDKLNFVLLAFPHKFDPKLKDLSALAK